MGLVKKVQKSDVDFSGTVTFDDDSVPSGTQQSHVADLSITTDLTGVDTGTDMTAAQAAQIEADLAAIATKLNAVLVSLEAFGIHASS